MAEQLPFGSVGLATNPEPRCPCVLLLDTSGSMSEVVGEAGKDLGYTIQRDGQTYRAVAGGRTRIDELNEGIRAYHADVMGDTLAAQRVEVSIITFGGTVETVIPFATPDQFTPPTLTANGETPMGAAIIRAIDAVAERKQVYKQNGLQHFRPWIFMVTDGEPTDVWEAAATKVQDGESSKRFAFFSVGVTGANMDILSRISVARTPLALKGYSFREMFLWLSASQRSVSQSNPGQEDQVKLSAPTGWASL